MDVFMGKFSHVSKKEVAVDRYVAVNNIVLAST